MPESGGTQEAPRTAIVIDEANLAMPATAGDGSTGVVLRLLRLRRSNGAVLVLGTQEPKDLNKEILSYASHPLTTHTQRPHLLFQPSHLHSYSLSTQIRNDPIHR